jgi:class 3 adenylate cyclase
VTGAPETRYARTAEGVHVAYQIAGTGSVDLLVCPDAFFAADQLRRDPGWTAFLDRLACFSRVILFDRRGTGLSDPISPQQPPTLEQWADDALAVLDTLGCERAALLGIAEGSFVATVLAATHPERLRALVLVHPTPGRSPAGAGGLFGQTTPSFQENLDAAWNGEIDDDTIAAFAPSKRGDPRFREWLIGALRYSLSPATAQALFDVNFWSNVDPILGAISIPTIVLHRSGNRYVPINYSRHVAASIPHGAFVEVPGEDHIVNGGDQQPILGEIEEFLTGTRHEPEPERVLATVLFTDIVASTEQLAASGDDAWGRTLDEHDRTMERLVASYRGRVVKSTGDGILAMFDGPARAVRCAAEMIDAASQQGITLRAGLHTGEIEIRPSDVVGIAVHTANRIAALAQPSEILVSRTVVDLTAGSGLQFDPRGERELKGVPGSWPIFGVQPGS